MLQQTQVSTVVPYFERFIKSFPTIGALAKADGQEVLRHWQGLGYYRRARLLHAAAKTIVAEFGGQIPREIERLLTIPGVGRYTAGAIASIAFDRRAPILDGNVTRVLCRIDAIESDPRLPATREKLWQRAEEILPAEGKRVGDFNSALMELGATVCTPRNPQCPVCPVQKFCQAFAKRIQDHIPPPKKSQLTPLVKRWTFCISKLSRSGEKYLIEQRPTTGRWAGMWQFVTVENSAKKPAPEHVKKVTGLIVKDLRHIGTLSHALTHRRYHFDVFSARGATRVPARTSDVQIWVRLEELDDYPLPRPHLKIAEMLRASAGARTDRT